MGFIGKALGVGFLGLVMVNVMDVNGCYDSSRTKQASRNSNPSNPVKTIRVVDEEWRDNSFAWGWSNYNPLVRRDVTFEDGTSTILRYRTHSWKFIKEATLGDMFDPRPGERYEVDKNNRLVRKVANSKE